MSDSKFQHRHYAAIADVLADVREGPSFMALDQDTINRLEDRLCVMFKADNDKFNGDRFRKAAHRAPDMHGKDKVR